MGLVVPLAGLAATACLMSTVMLAGVAHGGFADPGGSLRVAGRVWLAAHHVGFSVLEAAAPTSGAETPKVLPVPLRIAPLGLTAPLLWCLYRCGHRLASGSSPTFFGLAGLVPAYAGVLFAVAALTTGGAVRPLFSTVVVAVAWVFAGCAAGAAGARGPWPIAVRAGVMAAAALAAGGALLVTACLIARAGPAAGALAALTRDDFDGVDPGALVGLFLLAVALVPNAVVWAVSYASGSGFAVGAATVAPAETTFGAMPGLPPFTVLPGAAPFPVLAWAPLLLPLAAGVLTGVFLTRRAPGATRSALLGRVAGAALVVAALAVAAGRLASGTAGREHLAGIGPGPWGFAAALGAETAVAGAAAMLVLTRRRGRPRPLRVHVPWPARQDGGWEGTPDRTAGTAGTAAYAGGRRTRARSAGNAGGGPGEETRRPATPKV